MKNQVIVVAGPTASGKTALGIELARCYNGEIVSADSMQIYRGMDIGTAKATPDEQRQAVHHMLDVAEPFENYSVSLYVQQAEKICADIISRGKLPVIVGGTGLYIDSLLRGTDFPPAPQDRELRQRLSEEYDRDGAEAMHARLAAVDPDRAEKLAAADKRRIIRALEVYLLTGISATEHDRRSRALPPRFEAAYLVLDFSQREALYQRIELRVELMVENGLFPEVQALLDRGISPHCTAMQAIGYKEAARALLGQISKEEAVMLIKQESRRYAKRQRTWFRRREDAFRICWDAAPDPSHARRLSRDFLLSKGIS